MRIGFCCDGAKLKGYGCVGAVVSVYWSEPDFIDRFDNVRYKTTCWRFKLPLVRTPNKIVRALRNCNGSEFPPQAAYAVAKALYAGNMAVSLLKYPHLWVFCVDGASENTGTTSSFAKTVRDNLCSSNSIYEQLVLSQDIWLKVYEDAKASGLQGPLDAFFWKRRLRISRSRASAGAAPGHVWPGAEGPENGCVSAQGPGGCNQEIDRKSWYDAILVCSMVAKLQMGAASRARPARQHTAAPN